MTKRIITLATLFFIAVLSYAQTNFLKHNGAGGPVVSSFQNSSWDIFGTSDPTVISVNDTLKMWYTVSDTSNIPCLNCTDNAIAIPPYSGTASHQQIAYAWSLDGISWTKYTNGPVLFAGPNTWDELGVETVTVVYDSIASVSKRYKMWYLGYGNNLGNPSTWWQIGYAYSANGINWTKYSNNPVLTSMTSSGTNSSRTDFAYEGPTVLIDENDIPAKRYKMWYMGLDFTVGVEEKAVCYAWSADGENWTKHSNNPVIEKDAFWEQNVGGTIIDPCVIKVGTTYYIWYNAEAGAAPLLREIGYATSSDGVNWQKNASPVLLPSNTGWDNAAVFAPTVLFEDNLYKMWYSGYNNTVSVWANGYAIDSSLVLGINQISNIENIKVFPNPASELLTIDNPLGRKISIKLVNGIGQTFIKAEMISKTQVISLIDLPAGIYFLQIKVNDKQVTAKKIIKR